MKLKITLICLAVVACGLFSACDDWTEKESLDIMSKPIDQVNPKLYQEYLANLRNYKKSLHPLLIGWFDNSNKSLVSRGMHMADVPDKTDVLSLMYPDELIDMELQEMQQLHEMGTRIIYTIDCDQFHQEVVAENNAIDAKNAELIAAGEQPQPLLVFTEVLPTFLDKQLALLDKYNYDGFSVHYIGKSLSFLPDKDKAEMQNVQNTIFGKLKPVIEKNANKLFIFEGTPHFLLNNEPLKMFEYIVFRTYTETSIYDVTKTVLNGLVPGVPADKIIICSTPKHVDDAGNQMGEIMDVSGIKKDAIAEMAKWVKTPNPAFKKTGLGIWKINKDYYNPGACYALVQEAIDIMNPSAN